MENNNINLATNKSGSVNSSDTTVFQCNSFRSAFGPRVRVYNPVTPKEIDEYSKRVDKFGAVSFEKTGKKINQFEEIQSYADDTDINAIIARCTREGTTGLLAAQETQFVDVSALPEDFIGLYDLQLKLNQEYDQLPKEYKELFDNNKILYASERINGNASNTIEKYKNLVEAENQAKAEGAKGENTNG